MAESAESSEGQGRAYPAGFVCPECRYDLGGSAVARCSECGREVGAGDVRAFWARVELRRNRSGIAGRQLAFALLVGLVMGACTTVIMGDFGAGLGGGALSLVAIGASWALGGLAAQSAPRQERWPAMAIWMRTVWWLHAPWLCMPLCAAVAAAVAGIEVLRSGSREPAGLLTWVVGMFGFVIWFFASIAAFAFWHEAFCRNAAVYGVRWKRMVRAATVAAALVIGGSMLLGLAGGIMAMYAASRIGVSPF